MVTAYLPYDRLQLELKLPEGLEVNMLAGLEMPALQDPAAELLNVLDNPVGRPPLSVEAKGKDDCIIVVSDHTRNYAYQDWLPALLDYLNRAGLPDTKIKLYVASGTHRAMTGAEKAERFGKDIVSRVAVLDHDCDDLDNMVKAGRTDFGTHVVVDRRVFNADLVIITGAINYHYFAGYSGGRKAVMPGVCARETILANHIRALDPATGDFAPNVAPGVMQGNPVSEDMHEVCVLIRPNFCINAVINQDHKLAWLGAGDFSYVHRIGADWLDVHRKVKLERGADLAIISSGGYPKDLTLFQSHKSLRHMSYALNPGAAVVWAAGCIEGEGPPGMAQWREYNLDESRRMAMQSPSLVSFCSLSLKQLASKHDIHLVSNLDPGIVEGWGMHPAETVESAIGKVLQTRFGELNWLVGVDMSNLLPYLDNGANDD